MMGELLNEAKVTRLGVLGDRNWAARDETRGGIGSAKKVPTQMLNIQTNTIETVPSVFFNRVAPVAFQEF